MIGTGAGKSRGCGAEVSVTGSVDRRVKHRRRRGFGLRGAVGVLIMAAGAALLGAQVLVPDAVDDVAGSVVGSARQAWQQASQAGSLPAVQLGPEGDDSAIDTAPYGQFVEMASYRVDPHLQPVFAAHNGSGGDVILPWELGQHVEVRHPDGSTTEMVVSDARDAPQIGSTTDDLAGLAGTIVLQTCYWDTEDMRFVALTPVGVQAEAPERSGESGATLVVP